MLLNWFCFCYANIIFATQKVFFYAFFSVPISNFFASFIILISSPVLFNLQLIFWLLMLFCFNFSFLVFISFIFATQRFLFQMLVFYFCLKHWKLSCYWFFYFLIFLCINFASFISICISVLLGAHFFPFHIFLCFCFFVAPQLFLSSLMRFFTFGFTHLFC